jgi:hypothetical protein
VETLSALFLGVGGRAAEISPYKNIGRGLIYEISILLLIAGVPTTYMCVERCFLRLAEGVG